MLLLCCLPEKIEASAGLQAQLRGLPGLQGLELVTSVDQPAQRLQQPRHQALLYLALLDTQRQPSQLLGLQDLLQDIPLVLALPDEVPQTLLQALRLRPRYLTLRHDTEAIPFITQVVSRMLAKYGQYIRQALVSASDQSLEQLARSKAELIDMWIEDAKGLMQVSAGRGVFTAILKDDNESNRRTANDELREQVRNLGDFFSYINIANPQGEVRASSIPDSVGKIKVPDRQYFQKAMKSQTNVSEVYLARTTGQPAFSVATPIKDGDKVLGVIFGGCLT